MAFNIVFKLSIVTTWLLRSMASKSSVEMEPVHLLDQFSWKFQERNHVIMADDHNIDLMIADLEHFLLLLTSGTSRSKRRAVQLQQLAKDMKKELHPIPVAMSAIGEVTAKFKDLVDEGQLPAYIYIHHGKPILYKGRQKLGNAQLNKTR